MPTRPSGWCSDIEYFGFTPVHSVSRTRGVVEITPEGGRTVQPIIISDTPPPPPPLIIEPEPELVAQPLPPKAKLKRPVRQWAFAWKPALALRYQRLAILPARPLHCGSKPAVPPN